MATSLSRSKLIFHGDRSDSDDECSKRSKYNFNSWTIAYEVDIKMVDQDQLDCDKSWLMFFAKLALRTLEGNETYRTTKHIILDFKSVFAQILVAFEC